MKRTGLNSRTILLALAPMLATAATYSRVSEAWNPAAVPTVVAPSRTIEPLVSTEWLADNLDDPELVILDVRSDEDYTAGHIPNAVSAPFGVVGSMWAVMPDGLLLEVPEPADLYPAIGALGIDRDSRVVVVSAPNPGDPAPAYGLSAATRVAFTLIYSGLPNVAILDGGHSKWVADQYPTENDDVIREPVVFDGRANERMIVDKAYVEGHRWQSVIIDNRDPNVYFGVVAEPYAPVAGHIPGARSLPSPWIWLEDGTYNDPEILGAMAQGVVGWNKWREVIVYCGVGGYASAWWYLLTQVEGYRNVKFYDGSAQDWVGQEGEMEAYRWN